MDDLRKLRLLIRKKLMENDYGWEGPQPGDSDYHYPKQHQAPEMSFNQVDWKMVFDCLMANKEAIENGGKHPQNPSFMLMSVNDFTDHEEGLITGGIYDMLEHYGIIDIGNDFPVPDDSCLDYETFYNKVKQYWDKPYTSDSSPSQFRYRDDGGTDGG